MSAFMLSDTSWQSVLDAITEPPPYGDNIATELGRPWVDLMRAWYTANDLAVSSRYEKPQELTAPELLPSKRIRWELADRKAGNGPRVINPEPFARCVQYVKTLECLRYQCAESVPDWLQESHAKAMADLDRAIGIMALRAVHASADYDKAKWG